MIIYVGSSFGTSENAIKVFERDLSLYTEPPIDISFRFTEEPNECTHAILLNTAMPELSIPKENVIGLAFEPPKFLNITTKFVEYAKEHIGRYYIGDATDLPSPFVGHHGYMWHIPAPSPNTLPAPETRRKMSIMVSQKKSAPGHIYRHMLVSEILKTELPIDVWGRGCQYYSGDSRIRGNFDGNDLRIYKDYQFHIAIENFITPHYYSEKIINPILCNTIPVYIGCKNIDTYMDGIIHLTGNVSRDMDLLRCICEGSYDDYKTPINRKELCRKHTIRNIIRTFLI